MQKSIFIITETKSNTSSDLVLESDYMHDLRLKSIVYGLSRLGLGLQLKRGLGGLGVGLGTGRTWLHNSRQYVQLKRCLWQTLHCDWGAVTYAHNFSQDITTPHNKSTSYHTALLEGLPHVSSQLTSRDLIYWPTWQMYIQNKKGWLTDGDFNINYVISWL